MNLIRSTLDGAVKLAGHGLHVIRLHYPVFRENNVVSCSCGREGCKAQGKHPVGQQWGKSATTDVEVIRDWWREAEWNVGVLIGIGHGIPEEEAIIDIEDDTSEGRELAEVMLRDYPTVTWTSGKSLHRIYRYDPRLPKVANLTISGLEFRFGGYEKETQSVAPPSIHKSSRRYNWVEGRSLDDIAIAKLPDHIIEWISERYAENASATTGSPSSAHHSRFKTPGKKIHEPGRNNALLLHSHAAWRDACRLHGYNRLEESDVRDQVWLWVWGANLATCDPPLDEAEVWSIFQSSERFMKGELLREAQDRAREAAQMADPQDAVAESASEDVDLDAKSRSFTDWLAVCGIRLSFDPMCGNMDNNEDRVNEWQCNWKLKYITKSDQELVQITIGDDLSVSMKPAEFESARVVARKVAQESRGKLLLDRTFAHYNWRMIWEGHKNPNKNGITRGLREYLTNAVTVEDTTSTSVEDQLMGIIYGLCGNIRNIAAAIRTSKKIGPGLEAGVGRMKTDHVGNLITVKAPEDPRTGVYHIGDGEVKVLLQFDEVSRKFRGSYGGSLTTSQISDTIEKLGFAKERIRSGACEGRWFSRDVKSES